jgi:hypothetical protein
MKFKKEDIIEIKPNHLEGHFLIGRVINSTKEGIYARYFNPKIDEKSRVAYFDFSQYKIRIAGDKKKD